MTGQTDQDIIMEQHIHLFTSAMDAELVFINDNTYPHHANIIKECLQSEDQTDRQVKACQPPFKCLSELQRISLAEWNNLF